MGSYARLSREECDSGTSTKRVSLEHEWHPVLALEDRLDRAGLPATMNWLWSVEESPSARQHPGSCSKNDGQEGGVVEELLDGVRRAMERNPEVACMAVLRLVRFLTPPAGVETTGARGGLAPWQKRKVDRYLREHLDQPVRLKAVAEQVALSVSHFSRAFKESFGTTPHMHVISVEGKIGPATDVDDGKLAKPNCVGLWLGRPGAPFEAVPTFGGRGPKRLASSKPHRCSSGEEKPSFNERPIRSSRLGASLYFCIALAE